MKNKRDRTYMKYYLVGDTVVLYCILLGFCGGRKRKQIHRSRSTEITLECKRAQGFGESPFDKMANETAKHLLTCSNKIIFGMVTFHKVRMQEAY